MKFGHGGSHGEGQGVLVRRPGRATGRALGRRCGSDRRDRWRDCVIVDFGGDAELACALAEPDATRFTGIEVVVRQLLDVVRASVAALQRSHPNGHHTPPHTRVAVHSSVNERPSGRVVEVADMTTYAGHGIDRCSTRGKRRTGGRVAWDLGGFNAIGNAIATGSVG